MIDRTFWVEPLGQLVRQKLILEAKRQHAQFLPPLTLEAWEAQREQIQGLIQEHIGEMAAPCPLELREYGTVDLPSCSIKMVTYQSRPGLWVTANLYVPKGAGPFPAILVVHGHWPNGKASPQVQSRCLMFASEGYVVLSVDAFGSGERGTIPGEFEYHGANIGTSLLNIGQTLLGLQVNDNMRAIDLLQSLDIVDGEKIGVTGASGGGNQTMWISALDRRVKASVPVVSVGTFEIYITSPNCVCEMLPNGLTFTEEWAVLGMIAPRPLLILNSLQDPAFFSVQEMLRSYTGAREVYKLYEAMDHIGYQGIDLPHGYWPEMQRFALGWFNRWLKGEAEGRACDVSVHTPLPYEKLLVFPNADRPSPVQSVHEFAQPIARELSLVHCRETAPLSRQEKAEELERVLRLPGEFPCRASDARSLVAESIGVRCFQVEVEPGIPLPVELYCKEGVDPAASLLVVHHAGRQAVERESWMRELLESGRGLAFMDLRNTGSLAWDEREDLVLPRFHEASRSTIWLGRTMIGEWVRDLLAVSAHLKAAYGIRILDLLGYEDAGIAALCAATLSDAFSTVTTQNTFASYVPEKKFFSRSMAVHIPGILYWGDVPMMAVTANAGVVLFNPTRTDGMPYSESEIAHLEETLSLLGRRVNRDRCVDVRTGSIADLMTEKAGV